MLQLKDKNNAKNNCSIVPTFKTFNILKLMAQALSLCIEIVSHEKRFTVRAIFLALNFLIEVLKVFL